MTFRASSAVVDLPSYAASDPITITKPTGVVDGDLLLMVLNQRDSISVFTLPAGWTRATDLELRRTASDQMSPAIAYKIASSEPSDYTVTSDRTQKVSAVILAYSSIDAAVFDVTPTTAHRASAYDNNSPNPPAITTTTDNAEIVTIQLVSNAEITAAGAPTGYALRVDHTPFDDRNILIADKAKATAGLETIGSWNNTASSEFGDSSVITLALRPLPAPSITSVDTDNTINPGQTDVAIQLANAPASVTTLHEIKVGGTVSGETITGGEAMDNIRWNSGTPLFDVPSGATLGTGLAIHVRYTE